MEQTEPRIRWRLILLVLIIVIIVAASIFVLKGSLACACDDRVFESINSGLAP
jgi:hypothetical protein